MRVPRKPLLGLGVLGLVAVSGAGCGARREPTLPSRELGRPGLEVGVTVNALDDDMARATRSARAVGAGWIREEFRWPLVEPRRGRLRFDRYDRLMATTAGQGVRVLPLLIGSPAWTGARNPNQLPPSLGPWTAFVRVVIRRYGSRGSFWRAHPELDARLAPRVWEIWNEAYLPLFSPPHPDPARYAALAQQTVAAGRQVSPQVRFLLSAEVTYRAADGSSRNWLDDLFAAAPHLGSFLDGLAVHPYSVAGLGSDTAGGLRFDRLAEFQSILARHGVGRRPLWITEVGWSTCARRPPCRTPAQQGRDFAQALGRVAGRYRNEVAAFFAYRLDDLGGSAQDVENGFGLVARDGTRKPAWAVLRAAAAQSAPKR